jgi:DNA-directed RNA polymerase subunit RPC12/RpoP
MEKVEWEMYCGYKKVASGCGQPLMPSIQLSPTETQGFAEKCPHCNEYIMFKPKNYSGGTISIQFKH